MEDYRVLSIQSHVVSGYVGNKSAVFPLQVYDPRLTLTTISATVGSGARLRSGRHQLSPVLQSHWL